MSAPPPPRRAPGWLPLAVLLYLLLVAALALVLERRCRPPLAPPATVELPALPPRERTVTVDLSAPPRPKSTAAPGALQDSGL